MQREDSKKLVVLAFKATVRNRTYLCRAWNYRWWATIRNNYRTGTLHSPPWIWAIPKSMY